MIIYPQPQFVLRLRKFILVCNSESVYVPDIAIYPNTFSSLSNNHTGIGCDKRAGVENLLSLSCLFVEIRRFFNFKKSLKLDFNNGLKHTFKT